MTEAVRGWCPDLFAPMQSGDGWLLRIKPRLSRLSAEQARGIAAEAARCGNGIIELTGRGNIQIRGLTPGSAEAFARFAVDTGLADPRPAVERRRTILVSPLAGADACAVAVALEDGLAADEALAALPGKFGFAVDAGGAFALGDGVADIVVRASDGVWAEDTASAALRRARDWLASGATERRAHGGSTSRPASIGALPELRAFGIGLPFGQMDATTLDRLSDLSRRFGDGVLHLTPWRAIILSGVDPTSVAEPRAGLLPDLLIDAGDPRLGVSACIGRAGCASGSVDARTDALALIEAGVRAASMHVSGCAKGCAHPGPAAITLVGRDGRYGLVRDGRAGDTPQTDGLTVLQLARRLGGGADGS